MLRRTRDSPERTLRQHCVAKCTGFSIRSRLRNPEQTPDRLEGIDRVFLLLADPAVATVQNVREHDARGSPRGAVLSEATLSTDALIVATISRSCRISTRRNSTSTPVLGLGALLGELWQVHCCTRGYFAGKKANLPQLCPNNWVSERPMASRCVSPSRSRDAEEQRNRFGTGHAGTQQDLPDLPDNAEVASSILASPTNGRRWRGVEGDPRL
jgi:hypothetical protein